MFKIVSKVDLAPELKLFEVSAPEIAARVQPGQFIILRIDERGERIPLTVADFDRSRGLITLIFQEVGRSTIDLGQLEAEDYILDVVGPLGMPSPIEKLGRVVCIGGGVGVAPVYPITRALKEAGNEVISIIGARNQDYLILTGAMQAVSDTLRIATDDGSDGEKGFVTDILQQVIASHSPIDLVMAIGPLPMMQAVAELTRPFGIKTMVSMNTIMVDGTGMCGACRVVVGDKTMFACVDGPEFDGHQVDWKIAQMRARMFEREERRAMETCGCGGVGQCQKQK
ncbi:MAG: sulfide/dihydroorotate dehydrogenase-like FAD/NAD-binding protein [Firmicutes bacterium]|nr:sulfide/dihydroorotate dehydrogenase-like FAD/NAD-binding protein [Bacillota bacterium]